ncbi:uncharacterized protein LOC107429633 isoform X2 [Ziziphus jujuba]|uniref:Uncharacterized protein LOC107429633 isoform X2 n=1 Tax=Ziziphus jujuba TaxID=326968 RepID=A0A6P4BAD7_ZIZJJ|nr:uncharacterized protein LOC107429633 isoform X2 [Ziziphus jujuba]
MLFEWNTTMKEKVVVLVACCICVGASITAVNCKSDDPGEWQILTKLNFSSTLRLHPHILLLVTLPWSGECRSLRKEIATLVTNRQEEFSSLKLMVMYRNTEKMLADAIGAATQETTILYYHHSVSYKYQGRLTAKYILSSIYPYMSVSPEELPLKRLSDAEELKEFLDSTDKALLLFEFCGWAPKLLAKAKKNGTENGGVLGTSFRGETPTAMAKSIQKVAGMDDAEMKCGIDNGFDTVPWFSHFGFVNESALFDETENLKHGGVSSCSLLDFQQFDSFFTKFMTVAKDFFLPSERHRAGLVSERSILSTLGIQESGSWLAVLYFAGCPSCLRILNKEDDLNNVLKMDNPMLMELETDDHDLRPSLPANKPSMLLFVDRSSDSFETRRKGKEALDAFRELALRYHNSYHMSGENGQKLGKSVQDNQRFKSTSGHPRLKLSPATQVVKIKDKMSTVVILNDGKHVTLDEGTSGLQGGSLHEVLANLLKQKKEAKLSSLAKELGFQLLSEDIDIKLVNTLSSETEIQSDQVSPNPSKEDSVVSDVDSDKDQLLQIEENPVISKVKYDDEKKTYVDSSERLVSMESKQFVTEHEDVKVEETSSPQVDMSRDQQLHFQRFKGSFFFCDGNYQLLQSLTGGSEIPALVIVDPIWQQHYVFPKEKHLSYSSLDGFLAGFLNGSLVPYQQSESVRQGTREVIQPPFVNLDFHEADSLPRITSNTFSKLVFGFNQSGTDAQSKDVLVLFSNRWCGFCQRMELVVREVYRAVKGYVNMLRSESSNGKKMLDDDKLKDVLLKFPLIYLLDCTVNDCSLILRSINKREVYPSLMLFPAEGKNALLYEGHMSVTDIIRFIADRGSDSHHLIHDNGIILSVDKKEGENQNLHNKIKTHTLKGMHEASVQVVAGSILIATKQLLGVKPFDQSKILIVKADQNSGFEGLIFNKKIRWDAFDKVEEGLEILTEAPLSFGGPVIKYGMPLVALTKTVVGDRYPEILPGIFFLDQSATIHEIKEVKSGKRSIDDYWFFLGYSSWGWEQMFDEIAEGAWDVSDDSFTHFGWP